VRSQCGGARPARRHRRHRTSGPLRC